MWKDTLTRLLRGRRKMCRFCFVVVILCISYAGYLAEKSDSLFHKEKDVCVGKDCHTFKDVKNSGHSVEPPEDTVLDDDSKASEPISPDKVEIEKSKEKDTDEIFVIITFTNAEKNANLKNKFELTVKSMLKYASKPLAIHIIGDPASQLIADNILQKHAGKSKFRRVPLDVDELAKKVHEVVKPMQKHFSYQTGAYYNHALFFLSLTIHRVMPETMKKVVMLDCDLKFTDDIAKLYDRFKLFTSTNILGIANEKQPVYRHAYWEHRQKNPGTRVGEPGPDGLPGFNSGVLLLDLEKMRQSKLYNSFLTADAVKKLTGEFKFKGHLGDQDFFTILGMKYEELFHVLPCNWNRQLCTWWKDHGYKDIFETYYKCEGDIKIYHGNCNTPIP